jgi:hypothetical protein
VAVLRHLVADRRAERPGQDVGQPERQDGVHAEHVVRDGHGGDEAAEDEDRDGVAEVELLGERSPAAVPRAKVKRIASQ